jgi:hypothetical protein
LSQKLPILEDDAQAHNILLQEGGKKCLANFKHLADEKVKVMKLIDVIQDMKSNVSNDKVLEKLAAMVKKLGNQKEIPADLMAMLLKAKLLDTKQQSVDETITVVLIGVNSMKVLKEMREFGVPLCLLRLESKEGGNATNKSFWGDVEKCLEREDLSDVATIRYKVGKSCGLQGAVDRISEAMRDYERHRRNIKFVEVELNKGTLNLEDCCVYTSLRDQHITTTPCVVAQVVFAMVEQVVERSDSSDCRPRRPPLPDTRSPLLTQYNDDVVDVHSSVLPRDVKTRYLCRSEVENTWRRRPRLAAPQRAYNESHVQRLCPKGHDLEAYKLKLNICALAHLAEASQHWFVHSKDVETVCLSFVDKHFVKLTLGESLSTTNRSAIPVVSPPQRLDNLEKMLVHKDLLKLKGLILPPDLEMFNFYEKLEPHVMTQVSCWRPASHRSI